MNRHRTNEDLQNTTATKDKYENLFNIVCH